MSPPLIPDYKKTFILKQFVQTCLGGVKLFSPFPFIIIQIILFVIPAIVVTLVNFGDSGGKVRAIITGCSVFLVDFSLFLGILLLKRGRNQNNVTPVESIESTNGDNGEILSGSRGNVNSTTVIMLAESRESDHELNFLSEEDEV
jgi:hypothetical protein